MTVNIAVIGAGVVGSSFVNQLFAVKGISANLVYIATSKKAIISSDYSSINKPLESLPNADKQPLSTDDLIKFLKGSSNPAILVDNTSNQSIADSYPLFAKNEISIATPNKKGFSSSLELWNDIFSHKGLVYHEASVGAGLPLISPLKEMIQTGDEVISIQGIFSGTLSYIFNEFSTVAPNNEKFSKVVKIAKDLGYTEPDPRDDLNGLDVARKVTILARIAGLKIQNPTSFPIYSLIPKQLESVQSADEFMSKLPDYDIEMDKLKGEAALNGKVLRFVGSINVPENKVSVEIAQFDKDHPFASLKGSDNVVAITTKRYPNPLIIQGAGAGAEVTAMGVLGDVIKIAQRVDN